MRLWGERTLKRGWVACAFAGLTVLAAACGGGDGKSSTAVTTPQATAASGSGGSTPAAAAPAAGTAGQSRTFVDATGKSFTVEKPPKRVVALSPSVVELMYAVGAPPVARDGGLDAYARSHATAVAQAGTLFHSDITALLGVYTAAVENVRYAADPASVHAQFLTSAFHYQNLTHPGYRWVGIGAVDTGGTIFAVYVFAA